MHAGLVERESEFLTLKGIVEALGSGPGRLVLVSGEAGIGKTTLIGELRRACEGRVDWAEGACEPLSTPRPLGPLLDMADALGRETGAILRKGGAPHALNEAILNSLSGARQAKVMVWEDLHWADQATLDVLRFLARRIALLNLALIVTYRSDEVSEGHPLKGVLDGLTAQPVVALPLQPLSPDAVKTLARKAGRPGGWLYQATGGNPFFVTEVLADPLGREKAVPVSVREAVTRRQQRLDPAVREFLEVISVIPTAATPDLAEQLAPGRSAAMINEAAALGLLQTGPDSAIRFRHEIARLATLDRIPAALRRSHHGQVLKALLSASGARRLDRIVHHAAGALDAQAVLTYAPDAARQAARAGAHREAAAHLATALRFADAAEPALAATLYESWAYESGLAAHIDHDVLEARRYAITLWRALGRHDKVGENLRWLSRLHWYRGEAAEAARHADAAIRTLEGMPPSAEQAMAYSLRSQLHMLNDQMDEAIRWGDKALALERQFPSPELRAHALNNIATAMIFRGRTEGLPLMEESLAVSLENGLHEQAARAYTNLSEYAVEFRDFALAERVLAEGLAFDTRHDLDAWTYYLAGRQALLRMEQGRLKEAATIARGVVDHEGLSLLIKLPALQVLARACVRMNTPDAERLAQQALADALATDELQHIVPARLTLVEAAWLTGEPERAREHIEALMGLSADDRHPWNLGECAVWSARFGHQPRGPLSNALPEPFRLELEGETEAAAEAWQALSMPYAAALARLQQASPEALAEAAGALEAMGAEAAVLRARAIAAARGLSRALPRRRRGAYSAARAHPLGLTKREQDILELLIRGYSNRQISERLQRSQRTVEHHVSAIIAKFAAENRMSVMLRVQNEPWLKGGG